MNKNRTKIICHLISMISLPFVHLVPADQNTSGKKAYNYFYFTELQDREVPRRITRSFRLVKTKYRLKIQSANKSGAQK